MKIHLVKKPSIESFVNLYPNSRSSFEEWKTKIKFANWENPSDIKQTFRSADLLGNGSNRVIFNVGGNNYRMLCKYSFGDTQVHLYICWIGTHASYNELCKSKQQYLTNTY
ncbi:mRNA interferase HigB [Chitinophaga sp. CF118]|uniref:type II toxin-antitoxin system HigB family toxin n=1 Tax=Chitinophaga sp. CF118 TaxID=1884367 RepID=UPI0008EF3AC0|nr:type II toxin-antitoxin system HigB family toxin [Chitinophaga sp. CF118]SFE52463.1 mRNA interferase HigB [Chitinophaga sp. CF118]